MASLDDLEKGIEDLEKARELVFQILRLKGEFNLVEGCAQCSDEIERAYTQGKAEERERIINQLQDLIELSNKVKEPVIKVKMMDILQALKHNEGREIKWATSNVQYVMEWEG